MDIQLLGHRKWVALLAVVGLLLAGCVNVQSNMALYGQEQWSGVQAIQISSDFIQMMEQAKNDPNVTAETQGLDEWLTQAQNAAQLSGTSVDFKEIDGDDGSKTYVLQASGQGYEQLNQIFFEGKADISVSSVNGQRQVTIQYIFENSSSEENAPAQELTPQEQQMQQQMLEAFGLGITFRIAGDQILDSNATRVEGGTAIWENPTSIEVTLTEAAQLNPESIAVADVPAESSFDPQALTAIMQQAVQEIEPTSDTGAAAPQTTQNDSMSTAESGQAETGPAETTTQVTENTAPESEVSPAAPTQSDAALPSSGGILPQTEALGPVVLAGLVLAVLGGGAAVGLRNRR